jgi:Sec-independent protein secretion pathway component TatC
MSVSIQEIVIVLFACGLVALFARKRAWLWGIPAQLAVIASCTPADPVSTLVIGVPCSAIYAFALLKTERQIAPAAVPTKD